VKALAEIRGWLDSLLTVVGLYLTWRWRPRRERRDVTIHAPAATAVASMPMPAILNLSAARGASRARLALTTGDAGTRVVLDSMAELDADFPRF
jgi:hypothetical protein